MRCVVLVFAVLCGATSPAASAAASAPSCERLAEDAAAAFGLPQGLLTAIAHTESGRSSRGAAFRAWPWTSNIEGQGRYYSTRAQALTHLRGVRARGIRAFDVGCMQLNYHWHSHNFESLEDMIDPARNVAYAARYLLELKAETGDWDTATRYYHSRDPARGRAYLGRVHAALARLGGAAPTPAEPSPAAPAPRRYASLLAPRAVDRRFEPGKPLVALGGETAYWMHPSFGAGAIPRMP